MIKSQHMLNISTDVRLNTVDSLTGLVAYTIVGGYVCLFDGGYVSLDADGSPTSWNYYVADHLGSTR